ncbi:MAG: MarR family EPS-associated transcriptional regulator [Sphingomonas sp.]|uniref:MarR family EPS-associated transcriptional regulator n=1 Tax=Sphingomonas sp. TaxID=28214 RepID=UPI0025E1C122|nr:MarR family EPS-associated transcriptional regulator [Sphingomonas sp.]MBX3565282.1 MarR family EPS-associated transcriptional regulator [Sphingomonas sp.]
MAAPEKREDLHFRLLRLLEEHPEYSQRDISRALDVSLGGVNYCLKAMIDKGLIKIENFKTSRHKFGYLHVLTPQGIAERAALTNRFLRRKLAEYEVLKAEIQALEGEMAARGGQPGTADIASSNP